MDGRSSELVNRRVRVFQLVNVGSRQARGIISLVPLGQGGEAFS